MKDYLIEIRKANRKYIDTWTSFSAILDEWEDEHEDMGDFTIGLNYQDKYEVYINFFNTDVNIDIVNKACEDFNLKVAYKITEENHISDSVTVKFKLRSKDDAWW